MPDQHRTDSAHILRHNTILPEYPCSGVVIELKEFPTERLQVALCSSCGTEFQFVLDSEWVKVILPGMRNPV
jgi:hypothetical protein